MAEKEPKQFWVWGQVEESTHTAMMDIATHIGKHYRVVVELAVEQFIVNWVKERDEKNLPVGRRARFEAIVLEDRARQVNLSQLKTLAFNHMENQTEESAESLATACDLLGVPVEHVMDEITNQAQLVTIDNREPLDQVQGWLVEIMTPGKRHFANDIIDIGKARGFTDYKIRGAKAKLKIRSEKEGYKWVWILPEREPDE